MTAEIIGLVVVGVLVGRPVVIWRRKLKLRRYWRSELLRRPEENSFKIIVLGDSISEGVGATAFRYSYVGRVSAYIATKTGRPVFVANHAMAGATSDDLMKYQLPYADIGNVDLVLLEIGLNDGHKPRGKRENLAKNMKQLLSELPLEKTIVSDLPFSKLRKEYQAIIDKALEGTDVARAYPSKSFKNILSSLPATAGDFWHPNNKGHEIWFEVFKPGVDEVLRRYQHLKTSKK